MSQAMLTTDVSLLHRIRSDRTDPEAWARFVFLYGPHLFRWCLHLGLQHADAKDVTQDVLVEIWRQMDRFTYDPSKRFRSWLRVVVHAAWVNCGRRRFRDRELDDEADRKLLEVSARDDLLRRIEEGHMRELFGLALASVARRVEPRTMAAFRLIALEGISGKDAADQLGMKLGSTFAAKAKVQRMIREEVERLEANG